MSVELRMGNLKCQHGIAVKGQKMKNSFFASQNIVCSINNNNSISKNNLFVREQNITCSGTTG